MQFNKKFISIIVAAALFQTNTSVLAEQIPAERMLGKQNIPINMELYKNINTGINTVNKSETALFDWQIGNIKPFTPELWNSILSKRAGTTISSKMYLALSKSQQNIIALDYYLGRITKDHKNNKTNKFQNKLIHIHDTGRGGIIGKYQQEIDGVEVFGSEVSLLMNRKHELIASSGKFSEAKKVAVNIYSISEEKALENAFYESTGVPLTFPISLFEKNSLSTLKYNNGSNQFKWLSDEAKSEPVFLTKASRVKKVFFQSSYETLAPAYYVEAEIASKGSRTSQYFSYVIDGQTGKILFKNNLTAHVETTYKVFAETSGDNIPFDGPHGNALTPHPTGDTDDTPLVNGVFLATQNSITLDHGPISTQDPWLSDVATTTTGNNVDAYADISGENGFDDIDVRPVISSANAFEYDAAPFSDGLSGDAQQHAIVNLFYVNNFLHDWFYDNGFDEGAGNAQTDNFGRGGSQGDALLVEAQDSSGTNNANMSTPADGNAPRMQMFIWTLLSDSSMIITGISGISTRAAGFGPADYDLTGVMSLIDDGTEPVGDGCEAITTELTDKIAIIDRGDCNFTLKVKNAQDQGALGVIMVNNVEGDPITQGGEDDTVSIPSMMVTMEKGAEIRAALAADPSLQAQLFNLQKPLDGTLDNGIVAHEWAHYLSNRLVGNANGLSNNQGRSMGEGWSDFVALLMAVKESDNLVADNEQFQGVYSASTFVGDAYDGIRRAPYTTDLSKNAITFKHIENGVALPLSHPVSFGASGVNNAEVHASGEVWANTLWEGFVGLINKPGNSFDQARESMKDYLVAGLKLTPSAPTMLEARDALLAAAIATNADDFIILRDAFSKRGMGANAIAPDRESGTHAGVVEDFTLGADVTGVISINETFINNSCDDDGVLDPTESIDATLIYSSFTNKNIPSFTASLSSVNDVAFESNSLSIDSIATFGSSSSNSSSVTLNSSSHMQVIQVDGSSGQIGNGIDDFIEPNDVSVSLVTNLDFSKTLNNDDISETLTSNFDWDSEADTNIKQFLVSNGAWYGEDTGAAGASDLITPIIKVAGTGEFKVDFDHFYFFEAAEDTDGVLQNWDAGVVEISIDGASFVDVTSVGGVLSEAYNGTVNTFNDVIGGREAYTFTRDIDNLVFSANSISFTEGLVNGHDVRIRFRVGTDANTGDFGWLIDNVVVTNAIEPMFSEIVEEDNICIVGSAPTADAGTNQSIIGRDTSDITVNLVGTATDADADPLTIEWTQRAGPSVTINNADNLNANIVILSPITETEYVFQLSASDLTRTVTDMVTINAQPNSAPSVTAVGGTVAEGNSFTLNATGIDEEGDDLTYAWTQTAGQSITLSDASIANPIFTAPQVNSTTTLTFEVSVSDGTLESASATTNVSITDVPEPASSGGGVFSWFLVGYLAMIGRLRSRLINKTL
jgi:hypothetical protein